MDVIRRSEFLQKFLAYENERCCPGRPCRGVIRKTNHLCTGVLIKDSVTVKCPFESQAMKRGLGRWREMAASLRVSQL
jgi:hypothetical protein